MQTGIGREEVFYMLCVKQTSITQELDDLRNNKIPIRTVTSEKSMDDQAFERLITEEDGIRITLEFPCSPKDDSIIPEIKGILARMLNEYLEKAS